MFGPTMVLRSLILALAAAAPSAALAQSSDSGIYVGGLLGRTRVSENCPQSCEEASRAARAFAGYQINRGFGIELGAASLGETKSQEFGVPVTTQVRVVDFTVLGHWHIAEKVALFGRLGGYSGKTTGTLTDTSSGVTGGVGAQFAVTPNLGLRVEWQDYATMSNGARLFDINLLGIAALWRF
jgi:outer membrane protein with beta-barrel domain